MLIIREWFHRLLGTLGLRRHDSDLEAEMRAHLELAAEDARRRGGADGALRAARIRAGGVSQAMDAARDRRGLPWLDDLARDVRHGLRGLRRSPVFASVAILTLSLGIGANTAIFSIVNGVLLRPLAYPSPATLVYLDTGSRSDGLSSVPASVPEYLEFQQFNRSFADVGAFRTGETNLAAGGRAVRVRSAIVDAHLLRTLGVQPAVGRLFMNDETGVLTPPPLALLSYEVWRSTFGEQPIVGRSIDVDGRRVQVVGIMPPRVDLMDTHTQIWLPLGFTAEEPRARNNHNLSLIGRLREGITIDAARSELTALTETWAARTSITPGPDHAGHVFLPASTGRFAHTLRITPLADQILGRASQSIWVLQAAVGLLLLIACANLANLLLARAETRQHEFAVLTALGAGRGRLVRKVMTESVIIAAGGGALGVVFARVAVAALVRTFPSSLPRIGEVAVDPGVVTMSILVAVVCGLLFGLAPVVRTRTNATTETLASSPRGSAGTTRYRLRRALVTLETALAVIVIIGAGLLLRTVHNLNTVDAGFDRSRLITFSITLPVSEKNLRTARIGVPDRERTITYQRLIDQLRRLPGVVAATAMTGLPLESPLLSYQSEISNNASEEPIPTFNFYQRVMSGYFDTMGIPVVQGRGFEPADEASDGWVTVVNEALANKYWKGLNPIGQRLRPGGMKDRWFTVIGVAKDVKQSGVDQRAGTEAYVLANQIATDTPTTWVALSPTTLNVVMRTTLPLATLAPAITRAVRSIDASVPVARLREMDEVFTESIQRPRLLAHLLAAFSALALALAAIGIYGVLAYMVAERRREIGVRMALGAGRARVLREMASEGLRLTAAGVIAGAASALFVNRLLASLLFGIGPSDATTFALAIPGIALVTLIACVLPAWRASRLDPNVVLRSE
jgi:predicted permease